MAVPMSASERAKTDAWNASVADRQANPQNYPSFEPGKGSLAYGVGKPRTDASAAGTGIEVTAANGAIYEKLAQGYRNKATGQTVSGISIAGKSNVSYGGGYGGGYSGGASGYGGGGSSSPAVRPIEFYLGAAPSLSNLDLSSAMGNFRTAFNQINSGVNPNFNVDQGKLTADAKAAAASLNMSPAQIKAMIAGINPTTGEIISDVQSISKALNPKSGEQISAEAAAYAESSSSKIANTLNKKYQDEFESAMPGYKVNMRAANDLTSTYLAGKLPQGVVDEVFRNSAAKGFTTGLFGGGIGRNMTARDLGLTSLQLQTAGANLLQQTANIANSVIQSTMPVSGAEFVSGLASNYSNTAARFITDPNQIFSSVVNMKRVDPNTIFNAVYVQPSQVYNQMASMAQQSTLARANFEASKLVPPSQIFDALTSQAQYNSQINNANALNAWQSQPLPGQFDIKKGKFIGFTPGTYSATRPDAPDTPASVSAPQLPPVSMKKPSPPQISGGDYNTNAGKLAYYERQLANYNQAVAERNRAQAQMGPPVNQGQNYSGSAYIPQLSGFGRV